MKTYGIPFLLLFSFVTCFGQTESMTVVAEKGDGIFSLLRKHGIDAVKYYGEFLDLNKAQLNGGSNLSVGKTYVLPYAEDSFKNRGIKISVNTNTETPIFKGAFSSLKVKDNTLKNGTYYLVKPTTIDAKKTAVSNSFTKEVAKILLEKGAKVYVLDNENNVLEKKSVIGLYIATINKCYLKNRGSYQRVLFIDDVRTTEDTMAVSVFDYEQSRESKNLVSNLRSILTEQATINSNKVYSEGDDKLHVYFAKNLLPPVTTLTLTNSFQKNTKKLNLASLLAKGIENDYASVQFQD